ncbi:helix-turn-helix domain-containing protein [Butyrivibrio sp. CB08]|uniref:macro domain-containing protein n=1 Tax=Butyrivibrio sp. CB08 TaxID=2364879 RepID=UPI000EAA6307|nr:macro domain-containing protein [Butyrivibrio sp. CB08]RKM60360.1 helix-turn-helix domain-containing protein [Butyrivibrio sp. CB08]
MPFQIIRADITKVKADAIVNTANPAVAIGGGVDSALYKAAGEDKLLAAREKVGVLEPGEVGITPAFDLDARYIIHASGPWWEGGSHGEVELLTQCYDRALALALENGCRSIAFPLLATGTYGFPKRIGIEVAVSSFTRFLGEHEMEIYLVVFGESAVRISGELGEEVRSFIDEDYETEALKEEYSCDGIPEDEPEKTVRPRAAMLCSTVAGAVPNQALGMSLDAALKDMYTDTFEKHLQQYINKKGLKNSEVYAAANISKQYFSKLLKGQVKPSKEKVLALAVGLRLNLDEAVDFLRLAGYALSPVSQTDVIVEWFITHGDYNVMKIDIVLFDYGLDPLSKG